MPPNAKPTTASPSPVPLQPAVIGTKSLAEVKTLTVKTVDPGSDIKTFKANTNGIDLLFTDLHGNPKPLQQARDLLTRNNRSARDDRIFKLGDMIDRGYDGCGSGSYELYKLIWENNLQHAAEDNVPLIHAIRGNHENDFIIMYEQMAKNLATTGKLDRNAPLFQKAINDKKDTSKKWVGKLSDEQLGELAAFFSSLPYIIHIETNPAKTTMPCFMIHAGMPFDDKSFFDLQRSKGQLTDNQKLFATLARTPAKSKKGDYVLAANGRDKNSIAAFCGHNAHRETKPADMIHDEFSTLIFDANTPDTGIALGIFLNEGRVVAFGEATNPKYVQCAADAIPHLEAYLRTKHPNPNARPALPKDIADHLKSIAVPAPPKPVASSTGNGAARSPHDFKTQAARKSVVSLMMQGLGSPRKPKPLSKTVDDTAAPGSPRLRAG